MSFRNRFLHALDNLYTALYSQGVARDKTCLQLCFFSFFPNTFLSSDNDVHGYNARPYQRLLSIEDNIRGSQVAGKYLTGEKITGEMLTGEKLLPKQLNPVFLKMQRYAHQRFCIRNQA